VGGGGVVLVHLLIEGNALLGDEDLAADVSAVRQVGGDADLEHSYSLISSPRRSPIMTSSTYRPDEDAPPPASILKRRV
jgi:hypothetical protein